jgi:2-polyprenyl-6-methoxyphenol hydroxylase-like FAD-dependent oxidoreductase
MADFDVVVVGGGIAGSGLAAVLARAGLSVLVLEQSTEFRDRVRGEVWAPWGVAELQRVGLHDDLVAAGGHHSHRFILYDPAIPQADAEAGAVELSLIPGVPGALNILHPVACGALLDSAAAAGADVVRGVQHIVIDGRGGPAVSYEADGHLRRVTCRLIVGADGRQSAVRRQAGIKLDTTDATHLISGLLVEGLERWSDDDDGFGTVDGINFFSFPQGGGRSRVYLCHSLDGNHLFAGPDGSSRFLEAFATACLPQAEAIADARPAGPCATYPAEDTRCEEPYSEGVVLIGDAGGYSDPITGQGLSMAMRDVRVLSELLLGSDDWSRDALAPFGAEKGERMRRVKFIAEIMSTLFADFVPEAHGRRLEALARMQQDESLGLWLASLLVGPDGVPDMVFEEQTRRQLIG